jgi:hypothetical protein
MACSRVFNLFNHENFGSYVTNASSPVFRQPSFKRQRRVSAENDAARIQGRLLKVEADLQVRLRKRQSAVGSPPSAGCFYFETPHVPPTDLRCVSGRGCFGSDESM